MKYPVIHAIQTILPPHSGSQEASLDWLAYAAAKSGKYHSERDYDEEVMMLRIRKLIERYGAGPSRIASRRSHISDYTHRDWDSMELFRLHESPRGPGLGKRNNFYRNTVDQLFREFYANDSEGPDELIHVTCTGYSSPDGGQKLISERGWDARVFHVYHMGCYAAYPTLHHIAGSLWKAASGPDRSQIRVDAVHTELCTLHFDPSDYSPEKLVVHSLFADGHARYSAGLYEEGEEPSRGLRILALEERQIPHTQELMTWNLTDDRMGMTLSRDIPARIQENLKAYFEHLFARSGMSYERDRDKTVFAVHPGGPRIIDTVRDTLGLTDSSVEASLRVLKKNGNMSSATSPYIWKDIVENDSIPSGTPVAGVAFGPGLTVSGAMFVKT